MSTLPGNLTMQKTATVDVYLMWGTHEWVADILYRGEILATVDRRDLASHESLKIGVTEKAKIKALSMGFTRIKALSKLN